MDPGKIFQIITNSTLLATRLLSESGGPQVEFSASRYCTILSEDSQLASTVLTVSAKHSRGVEVRYSITGGNKDGLFTIDQHTGVITLAAALDHETHTSHELEVSGEGGGAGATTTVQVRVADVNDNPPYFLHPRPQVTVIEEDNHHLPTTIATVVAEDMDFMDHHGLLYTVSGDGIDGFNPGQAFFTINSLTGQLTQLKALDRDPPRGKAVWKVKVQVRDGQALWSRQAMQRHLAKSSNKKWSGSKSLIKGRSVRELVYHKSDKPKERRVKREIEDKLSENFNIRKVSSVTNNTSLRKKMLAEFIDEADNTGGKKEREINRHTILKELAKKWSKTKLMRLLRGKFNSFEVGKMVKRKQVRLSRQLTQNSTRTHIIKKLEYPILKSEYINSLLLFSKNLSYLNQPVSGRVNRSLSNMCTGDQKCKKSISNNSLGLKYEGNERKKSNELDNDEHNINSPSKGVFRGYYKVRRFSSEPHTKTNKRAKRTVGSSNGKMRGKGFSGIKDLPGYKHYEVSGFNSDNINTDWDEEFGNIDEEDCEDDTIGPTGRRLGGSSLDRDGMHGSNKGLHGVWGSRVHVAETEVTIRLKDVNDNPPVFPNTTMFGLVQENGPIDLSVVTVAAWDADDGAEGSNAKISYGIQKNAMHEGTGQPIFSIHPDTGLVRTAVCCLDRETTNNYQIQVVATDGGGLHGTGLVMVRLADVNDNAPQLEQKLWEVEVDETWGDGPPDNTTLLKISVLDPDTSNYFHYRVVESSGWGWQHFGIESVGTVGYIYARQVLDYEDETHRRGFRFMVQVTDRGRGGWEDSRHVDSAWVVVKVRDVNDNPPQFARHNAHITVREDAKPGTLLAALPALDPDQGGHQEVEYRVEGGWDVVSVNSGGDVSLSGVLDREAPEGAVGMARILCVDQGRPPLTATATLTITVTDVNDTPPFLLPPTVFHVTEGAEPTSLGNLIATDHDVWALGHGPPFKLTLAPSNPPHVLAHIALTFDSHLDSGRGGGELKTIAAVDREAHPQLDVDILVSDAGGLNATHKVIVIIDDTNDNPMKPGTKTVYLWKPQGGSAEAPLGRVFVEDPDDWDVKDKSFSWVGTAHPLFSLNTNTGHLIASSQVREGRYELHLSVSDRLWGQKDVSANVTVSVKVLSPDALSHAAPITLTPTTPEGLTRHWTPQENGGMLGGVVRGVLQVMGEGEHTVEVVSVENRPPLPSAPNDPVAAVWVCVKEPDKYMHPIKLRGLLAMKSKELEKITNLTVVSEEFITEISNVNRQHPSGNIIHPATVASRASTLLPLQVVDTNTTSLVTPRLKRSQECHINQYQTCSSDTCLNGGRCLAGDRCVCPGGSWGPHCKVLSRTFSGQDWTWVRPLPPCLPLTISLLVLTRRTHALLLYSGPLAPLPRRLHHPPTPMLALQLWEGRPQLLVEGGGRALKLEVPTVVSDGYWHTLHLKLTTQGVALMVDVCGQNQHNESIDELCTSRASWNHPSILSSQSSWPVQLGGVAHVPQNPSDHGWRQVPTSTPLDGCISNLRLNGQLVDLGEPPYKKGGKKGCRSQEFACPHSCGHRGHCTGGLIQPQCECELGWTGPECTLPTVPVSMTSDSYVKMALNFTPNRMVTAELRLRTRGVHSGSLLSLGRPNQDAAFVLYLKSGLACVKERISGLGHRSVCVEGEPLGDGEWHTLTANLQGQSLTLSVDDKDGWRQNESLPGLSVTENDGQSSDQSLILGLEELRVIVGSLPAAQDENKDVVCVDDVRVCGRALPLPPAVNGSRWGQVTRWKGMKSGCTAQDACLNTTCVAPLSCMSNWGVATCSCGTGRQMVNHGCRDVDECMWRPCLHGGTCRNLQPGYQCVCGPSHTGDHCQWSNLVTASHSLTAPLAIAAIIFFVLILVVVGVLVSVWLRRVGVTKAATSRKNNQGITEIPATDSEDGQGDADQKIFLECLKVQIPINQSPKQDREVYKEQNVRSASQSPAIESTSSRILNGKVIARVTPSTRIPKQGQGQEFLPAQDDLRAYAYEGDGSSSGSLSSALSGLREEHHNEDLNTKNQALIPGFVDVMDLLKNLPDAARCPSLTSNSEKQASEGGEMAGNSRDTPIYTIADASITDKPTSPKLPDSSLLCFHDEESTTC